MRRPSVAFVTLLCGGIVLFHAGRIGLQAAAAWKKSPAKAAKKKPARRSRPPQAPPISAAERSEAADQVALTLERNIDLPLENPAAMVPFYEQLYREQAGLAKDPLHIIHYGDSHT